MSAFLFSQVQQLTSRVSIAPLILNAIHDELYAIKFAHFLDLAKVTSPQSLSDYYL